MPRDGILLIDEQTGSRDLIRLVLGKLGHRVEAVASASEALDRLAATPFALILLSSTVRDLPTATAMQQASAAAGLASAPPVIVLDPGEPDPAARPAHDPGAEIRLARPVEIDRLLHWVKQLLDRPRPDPGSRGTGPVVDLAHLDGYTDGDRQLEGELAELYLSTARVYLERMQEALDAGEPWSPIAHALKGASANLGALRVAALARTAEQEGSSAAQLHALREAVEDVAAFFARRPV